MAYLRFVIPQRHSDSGVDTGVFQAAHELLDSGELGETELILVREAIDWFNAHLPRPARFNRTTSKGHYRRRAAGIAWFRDTATECLARMHALKAALDAHGRPVSIIRENRIGYVVYEDELQVVAEPFTDTRTSGE